MSKAASLFVLQDGLFCKEACSAGVLVAASMLHQEPRSGIGACLHDVQQDQQYRLKEEQ
ncbi:hypothetical protein [Halomonas marinisediminis]|uniref:hypothetical protein n=1 Tax=Halomonas marinisediminis TaxID=2546095 RepID=UPI0014046324|nr:hypothetical protein [Halomonas marinisediminis]